MRPINLIPEADQRRTRGVGSRTGPLPFLLVGALALALIGVVMLIHYSNQISDREDNLVSLQSEKAVATARADATTPYVSFAAVTEQRTNTIAELANQRFDWPRVIRQLSLVLPSDVYFTSLSASSGGGTEGESGVSSPSMAIGGCASSQDAVAGFVATLKQIDGVTRVSLQNSTSNESEEGEVSGASSCATGGQTQFSLVVVFDFAPASPDGGETETIEAESPPESSEESSSESESSSETESSSESESSTESESSEPASGQSASTAEGGAAG